MCVVWVAQPWCLYLFAFSPAGATLPVAASGIIEGVVVMLATLGGLVAAAAAGQFTLNKTTAYGALAVYAVYLVYACAPAFAA